MAEVYINWKNKAWTVGREKDRKRVITKERKNGIKREIIKEKNECQI